MKDYDIIVTLLLAKSPTVDDDDGLPSGNSHTYSDSFSSYMQFDESIMFISMRAVIGVVSYTVA